MLYRKTTSIVSAAVGGCVTLLFDRWWNNNNNKQIIEMDWRPGLPTFSTVSAATPMTNTLSVPSIPDPSLETKGSHESRISEIMRFGFPSMDSILSRRDYVVSYDRRNRTANWVFEHLTRDSVRRNDAVDRAKSAFMEDPGVHPYFRSQNDDYQYSGFDRGHLAAAANHRQSQEYCNETFYLSNVAPQVGAGFNRDKWEHLERRIRKLTKYYKNVYVCTGPLYLPKRESDGKNYVKYRVIGINNVAVPTHFFKVVVAETGKGTLDCESYVLPNEKIDDDTPLSNFMVPPDSIERAAGLLFFNKISKKQLQTINGKSVS